MVASCARPEQIFPSALLQGRENQQGLLRVRTTKPYRTRTRPLLRSFQHTIFLGNSGTLPTRGLLEHHIIIVPVKPYEGSPTLEPEDCWLSKYVKRSPI